MNGRESRIFRARREELPAALAFVDGFCRQHGVRGEATLRLTLIVEELFTNVIVHGHGGDSDATIEVALRAGPSLLTLHVHDSAPPFDPLRHLAEHAADLALPAAERRLGGLGLPLIAQMSEGLRYAYADGRNRISLSVRLD